MLNPRSEKSGLDAHSCHLHANLGFNVVQRGASHVQGNRALNVGKTSVQAFKRRFIPTQIFRLPRMLAFIEVSCCKIVSASLRKGATDDPRYPASLVSRPMSV